jgi:hypothetical protein
LAPQSADPNALPPSSSDHSDVERSTNGASYRMLVDPQKGTFDLIPLAPPDYVSIFYTNFATAPSGTGSNTVSLHTSQTMSTYTNSMGVCFSGGAMGGAGCTALPAGSPCRNARTACAIVQAVNNFADPLPDVIVQLSNNASDTRNSVVSCTDNGGAFGQCNSNANNANKVDNANSTLTSAIGSGSTGCSFCYNNASDATVGSNPGLRDALLAGSEPTGMSTDTWAFVLTNDNPFGVNIFTYYARPYLEPNVTLSDGGTTPACATTAGTIITATGGGMGPPSGCTTSSCPASGTPATGYIVDFVQSNMTSIIIPAAPGSVTWSDNTVSAQIDTTANQNQGYAMRVRTPLNTTGVMTSSPAFSVCQGAGAIDHFGVSVQGNPRRNQAMTFTVIAEDASNRRIPTYAGTITVSISPDGTLNFTGQPNYTFTVGQGGTFDNGSHKFTGGATPTASGQHTISVTDNMGHTGSVSFSVAN